jgi:hypothetical protein
MGRRYKFVDFDYVVPSLRKRPIQFALTAAFSVTSPRTGGRLHVKILGADSVEEVRVGTLSGSTIATILSNL